VFVLSQQTSLPVLSVFPTSDIDFRSLFLLEDLLSWSLMPLSKPAPPRSLFLFLDSRSFIVPSFLQARPPSLLFGWDLNFPYCSRFPCRTTPQVFFHFRLRFPGEESFVLLLFLLARPPLFLKPSPLEFCSLSTLLSEQASPYRPERFLKPFLVAFSPLVRCSPYFPAAERIKTSFLTTATFSVGIPLGLSPFNQFQTVFFVVS